jgi:hypothetical protein
MPGDGEGLASIGDPPPAHVRPSALQEQLTLAPSRERITCPNMTLYFYMNVIYLNMTIARVVCVVFNVCC